MNWFKGEISDAINKSKAISAVFVVFVEGQDDKSKNLSEQLNQEDIASNLNTNSFVCIKIEHDTVPYHQFKQFYQQVETPSLFFIGTTGAPLDVVYESKDVSSLKQKIGAVLATHAGVMGVSLGPDITTVDPLKNSNINKASTASTSPPGPKTQATIKPEAPQRRPMKKINLESDRPAPKRVDDATAGASAAPIIRHFDADKSRIQFRLPDSRTYTKEFKSTEKFKAAFDYVQSDLSVGFSRYVLSTTFPRHEFTDEDKAMSFSDLGLVPTAVILILPINGDVISTNSQNKLMDMFWAILAPVFSLLNYAKTAIFGTGATTGTSSTATVHNRNNEAKPEPSPRPMNPRMQGIPGSTVVRRHGNIHHLSHRSDSDDENNTWNGNSTQQM